MEIVGSPTPDEYAPFYETYVSRVPEGDIVEILSREVGDTLRWPTWKTTPASLARVSTHSSTFPLFAQPAYGLKYPSG